MTPAALIALMNGELENFTTASTPGGIEAQEARGQQTLVNGNLLPADAPWEELQAMGVVKGKSVDDLFVEASLPAGWTKVATGHSMWSELRNADGKVVANIFYKAAFYDRNARLSLVRE